MVSQIPFLCGAATSDLDVGSHVAIAAAIAAELDCRTPVVAGAGYLYVNKDTLVENARERVTTAVTEAVSGALPGLIDAAMPELPSTTGPAIPTLP